MVLHEKCCAICLLIFFNKLCNDAISTTVLIFLPVRSGNVVINNLIILFHHKRSTAVQLNCIVVPSSQQLTCIFRANFWKRAWQFWKTCATVSCVRRNYSSITAPEIIITGRVLYILRTLMTMIHRGRASLDFRTTCWFVNFPNMEYPTVPVQNCSKSI